jgi:hypothetical protein
VFFPFRLFRLIKPVKIHLTNIDKLLSYSILLEIPWTSATRACADIEFDSGAVAQIMRYGTGYDTFYISGRFAGRRPGVSICQKLRRIASK